MKLMMWKNNILKIYLTLDELLDKGLTIDDLGIDCIKVHNIVQEIVENACKEFDFLLSGALDVKIFSLQEQGLMMIVSRDEEIFSFFDEEDEDHTDISLFCKNDKQSIYSFLDFEDIVQMCKVIGKRESKASSSLYHVDGVYYMCFDNIPANDYNSYGSIVSEYGTSVHCGLVWLEEYGELIMHRNAIEQINTFF